MLAPGSWLPICVGRMEFFHQVRQREPKRLSNEKGKGPIQRACPLGRAGGKGSSGKGTGWKGMRERALSPRKVGRSRKLSMYRAVSTKGPPTLETIMEVLKAVCMMQAQRNSVRHPAKPGTSLLLQLKFLCIPFAGDALRSN